MKGVCIVLVLITMQCRLSCPPTADRKCLLRANYSQLKDIDEGKAAADDALRRAALTANLD